VRLGLRIGLIARPPEDGETTAALRRAAGRLRAAGHRVRARFTFDRGDGLRFARWCAARRYDLVIAAGGDGTVNEVVNGIAGAAWQPRLGIVPLGTANDFATGVGLPAELAAAVEVAVSGRPRAVDVARVNERYFINVSTGGFGAEATESAPPEAKRLLGPWAYLITGARKFVDLRAMPMRVEADGRVLESGRVLLFAVGNGRQTGGGTLLTPRAELCDGKLDLLIVPELPRLDLLALLPDLRAGSHLRSPDITYARVQHIVVEAEEELSVNADGEPLRGRRFEYAVAPRPLGLMVP
jgi:diacylglycerol kinase (ATP)